MAGRSVGKVAVPAIVLVLVANVVLRDTNWSREWMWAFYQYHFVTTLLGPVVAGLGAWEGVRWSGSADLVAVSRRPIWALVAIWAALCSWIAAVYLAGVAVVGVFASWSGAPGFPPLRAVVTVLPALGLLGALAAVGMAAGRFFPTALTPPVVAVAAFGFIVLGYTGPVGPLVTVGGATGGLLHLRPRLDVQVLQVLVYAVVVVVAVLTVAHGRRRVSLQSAAVPALAGCVLLVAGGVLVSRGSEALEVSAAELVCDQGQPVFCVADGYRDLVEPTRERLTVYLDAIDAAGLPAPTGFSQALDPPPGFGPIDLFTMTRDDPAYLESSIVSVYVPGNCDGFVPPYSIVLDGLYEWLWVQTGTSTGYSDHLPDVFRSGDDDAIAAWLGDAIATLPPCPRLP